MKRDGYFTLVLALMMLLFATLAAVFINEMSKELFVTISKLDQGKEERYNKIVMKSIENSIESISGHIETVSGSVTSNYSISLPKYYTSTNYSSLTIDFKVVSELIHEEGGASKDYFFQVEIEPSTSTRSSTETLGAIIKYSE